jgi:hypothetical protein
VRTVSVISPALTAARRADRSESVRVTGVISFVCSCRNTTSFTPVTHPTGGPLSYTTTQDTINQPRARGCMSTVRTRAQPALQEAIEWSWRRTSGATGSKVGIASWLVLVKSDTAQPRVAALELSGSAASASVGHSRRRPAGQRHSGLAPKVFCNCGLSFERYLDGGMLQDLRFPYVRAWVLDSVAGSVAAALIGSFPAAPGSEGAKRNLGPMNSIKIKQDNPTAIADGFPEQESL